MLYGPSIEKDLLQIAVNEDMKGEVSWSSEVYFTNVNYQAKKTILLLFINCASPVSLLEFSLFKGLF